MLEIIISGGQTGVDQAAWRAAKACGLKTGGVMPRGFLTEEGDRPEFAELFGAEEHELKDYPPRTKENVSMTDATLIVNPDGGPMGLGTSLALRTCEQYRKPHLVVGLRRQDVETAADWIRGGDFRVLNIAGPRRSSRPQIGELAEAWLVEVFQRVAELERESRTVPGV